MNVINRREFVRTASAATLGATVPSLVRCAAGEKKKDGLNVLFLMTDEQHWQSLSSTGNSYIETPNMDRLGAEGVRFDNATCVTPYCSPSRASILTGLYPHTHDVLLNVSPGQNAQPPLLQNAFPNTETMLHRRGYATAHRGKWHLGDQGDFDCYESMGYAGPVGQYQQMLNEKLPPHDFKDHPSPARYLNRPVEMTPRVEKGFHEFHALPNNRLAYISIIGKSLVPPELLPETQITDQVLGLIDEHRDENFMITASWSPPHDLWVIPEPYYSMVDRRQVQLPGSVDMPEWDQNGPSKRLGDIMGPEGLREYAAIYHGMVKYIDDQLGRILQRLDDHGLADNTLVIFTSDHGDMVGAHGCIGKSIFSFYDDLVRIPLLMRLPGWIKPGTVIDKPVSQIDLMPTIMDYAEMPIPEGIHGASIRPLVEGRNVPWRDYAFCQRANQGRMLRTDRYKFFLRDKQGVVALYDLKEDPHEDRNLANDAAYAKSVRDLHERLLGTMRKDGDPQWERFARDRLA
jgi:arylsulfatase A-like enzyme